MSTKRENIFKVFRHEMPDYIPITVSCDPYNQPNREGMPAELADRLGTVQWLDTSPAELARWFDIEVWLRTPSPVLSRSANCAYHTEWDGDTRHSWWETPRGELHERWRRMPGNNPMFCMEHLIKNESDLKLLAFALEDQRFELDPAGVERIAKRRRYIGDDGMLEIAFHGTPLGMLVRVFTGLETLAYMTVDCEKELRNLLEVMADNYLRQLRLLETVDADTVWSVDDTSTTTISPSMFETYAMPYIDRAASEVQRQGKFYVHHSCGHIKDLVGLYRETRMDAVQGLCIPPLGNVTIAEARQKLGAKIVMMAAAVQMAEQPFDRKTACAGIARMFREAAPGDNFILNMAAFPNRTIADMECILDECRKHRMNL